MVFSSPLFLFLFLPITLLLTYLTPRKYRNITLLIASVLFYVWGESEYSLVMLFSAGMNYIFGQLIERSWNKPHSKVLISLCVILNLSLLIFFKYANFIVGNVNIFLSSINLTNIYLPPIHLPLGISFFTFHSLSYVIDVYRKEIESQKSFVNLFLYITLFPQLVAGPILRYHDIAPQLIDRSMPADKFAFGIQRFILGFAKKVILANYFALIADEVFSFHLKDVSTPLAWLGIICYTLQIYFDFSGYSDMAIGLGRMLGFEFMENFNYPYIARSIQEFWRRWHISLSTWFRDYLYIPLGGSRVSKSRLYFNLLTVFFLTGLWHGASWSFVFWGVFHGIFLVIERLGAKQILSRLWLPLQHLYTLLVVMIAWVFFRADSLMVALAYCKRMFIPTNNSVAASNLALFLTSETIIMILIGGLVATPIRGYLENWFLNYTNTQVRYQIFSVGYTICLFTLFLLSITYLAANTYNPFIYFRF